MKLTVESTNRMVEVEVQGQSTVFRMPARVWEGHTEAGVKVACLIVRVAVPADQDQQQFQRELKEHAAPTAVGVDAFPLRMLI